MDFLSLAGTLSLRNCLLYNRNQLDWNISSTLNYFSVELLLLTLFFNRNQFYLNFFSISSHQLELLLCLLTSLLNTNQTAHQNYSATYLYLFTDEQLNCWGRKVIERQKKKYIYIIVIANWNLESAALVQASGESAGSAGSFSICLAWWGGVSRRRRAASAIWWWSRRRRATRWCARGWWAAWTALRSGTLQVDKAKAKGLERRTG